MKSVKSPLLFTLFFLAITASSAKTYSGRVIDSETEESLAGVSVTLLNSSGKDITNQLGQFSFSAEVSIASNRISANESSVLKWQSSAAAFDLKSAPGVTSVIVYSLKGERLFFGARTPGSDMIALPFLRRSTYLVRIASTNGTFFTVKWVHAGGNVSFRLNNNSGEHVPVKSGAVSGLMFEKQGYQTKQTEINDDSVYTSMLIKMKPEIGSNIFNDDTVRTYRLYFSDKNMAMLLDFSKLVTGNQTVNTVVVPARLEFEGRTLDSVGIRFRGDQSIWDCISNGVRKKNVKYPQFGFGNGDICAKFSMKFDFNRYKKDQRLSGLKALNFRSMSADPTKMHEKLGYSLFNEMGILSPRAAYAKLFVNDTLWGLFGVVENIDGRFTKSRYPETGDGNLYKDLWPEDKLTDVSISKALETNNDTQDNPDISDFKAFRDTVLASGTTEDNLLEKSKAILDVGHLVRYIVVDRGIMNFDGIMSCYTWTGGHMRHNYCWYHDDESGLFRLVPWDLDKVFIYPEPNFWTNNKPAGNNIVPNWNVVNSTYGAFACTFDPGSSSSGYNVEPIDKDKFLRLLRKATWNDFCGQGQFFLDSVFTVQKVDGRIQKWRTLIAGAVGEDPVIDSTEWSGMVDSLSRTIPLFRKNLEMMIDTLILR